MRLRSYVLAALLCFSLAACGKQEPNLGSPQAMPVDPPGGSGMLTANTYAGDALNAILVKRGSTGASILVSSLVRLDDFERTSAFGQLSSQQIASRLGQQGFRVLEVRLGTELRMERKGGGEFMLTRDSAKLLSSEYNASSVLVGCFQEVDSRIFVSVRVVRLSDNAIIGAYEYYLPKNSELRQLLDSAPGPHADVSGDDSVWSQYSRREQAFGGKK